MTTELTTGTSTETVRFAEIDAHREHGMIIGGDRPGSVTGRTFACLDPYEDVEWGHVPQASAADVDLAVAAARRTLPGWAATPAAARAEVLTRWAEAVRQHVDELARLQVHENGKTIAEMSAATPGVAAVAQYAAMSLLSLHGRTLQPAVPGHSAWTLREPLGVVACITPWNNPLVLLSWKLMPAVAAGNTVVVKPSEVTPVSTLRLVELGLEAGLPPGVVNVVTGAGEAGAALAEHPDVAKVAFTGSTGTGRRIAEAAARRFAATTLELGGKGPQIVFADADLDRAVASLRTGVIAGTGQACNAGSRLLVQADVYDDVVGRLVQHFGQTRIGDPLDERTEVGPLASRAQYEKVTSYLDVAAQESREASTSLLVGGRRGPSLGGGPTGLFVEPTLFETPDAGSRIRTEEIFGPVGAVIRFTDEQDALRLANESRFGLVSGVWTRDLDRARRASQALRAGVVWINTWRAFSPNVPFGGRGDSGTGHELGIDLLEAYTTEKAVWLGHAPQ